MERDSLTPKDAAGRMGAQRHDEFYSSKSDFVIFNNGDIHELYAKATEILRHTGVRGEDKT
jgi:dephospho-CoA kinase